MYKLQPICNLDTLAFHSYEVLNNSVSDNSAVDDWDQVDKRMFEVDVLELSKSLNGKKININLNVTSDSIFIIQDSEIETASKLFNLTIEWVEKRGKKIKDEEASLRFNYLRDKYKIAIALDDAMSGECFLNRAALITPDFVKIDGAFFKKATKNNRYLEVLKATIESCKRLDIRVAIEWIESEDDYKLAKTLGADFGQGYYLDSIVRMS